MIANDYAILERAVEDGIRCALRRFNKHREVEFFLPPGLANELSEAIMSSASEVFFFNERKVVDE